MVAERNVIGREVEEHRQEKEYGDFRDVAIGREKVMAI